MGKRAHMGRFRVAAMNALDPLDAAILAGAVAAIRRRAERQRGIANSCASRVAEAATAARIADALSRLANEIETEAGQ
jgi:hypothetical protein